ncbi:MAG: TRAM domain-containing protein, partial [Dehalococcoidia bacterium]
MRRRRRRRRPDLAAGELLTLRVGESVAGGTALARTDDGRVVLVAFAAPGELVSARVERTHPDYLEASTEQVLEPSPDRVEPACPLFGDCGGCQFQHLAYAAQLRAKEHIVREQLERIGKFPEPPVRPIVGAPDPWGYRNHVRFSTGQRDGDVGFVSRRTRGLLKVEHCPITDPWINGLLPDLQGRGRGLHQVQVRHNPENDSYLVSPAIQGLGV